MLGFSQAQARREINLTPVPTQITQGDGEYTLPHGITVAGTNLTAEMTAEINKFVQSLNSATPLGAKVGSGDAAQIQVLLNTSSSLGTEGYKLTVTTSGVKVEAPSAAGLYYAFQTIKMLLPPNVMAGVKDASVTTYSLPEVAITDTPRFRHRGFELDSSRHFWDLKQVKRMLDLMSYYKMNRFHWHLTDDQGWRVQIDKYPKLTELGSISPNSFHQDFDTRYQYLINKPYGPYFYTKADLREIVAYAKERHIEIIPEIDMPGHMVAAIHAYPEFSCNPGASHDVWYRPGVSSDVLNVANPAVVQFCKDVISELCEIFPYEYFHIGGDETPSTNWESNPACQRMMQENGWTEVYKLQSWFTKQMADHLKTLNRRAVCWNEVVTAGGADGQMAKDADILVYDWLGNGTGKADELGLRAVWCHTSYYYLDYGCSSQPGEPRFMGGAVSLPTVYGATPFNGNPDNERYLGVQGNLWCEYISDPKNLEYNALPRLIAIAETGWSPGAKKNYADFQRRITADTTLWNYNNYTYGRHYLLGAADNKEYPTPGKYYRLVSRADNQGRAGRCIELVRNGSSLISSLGASEGRLWTAPVDETNADWQLWTFEKNPNGGDTYAMVCKAQPNGSVNPQTNSTSTDARWNYDNTTKHYSFKLGEGDYYGTISGNHYYSVRSILNDGYWLNCGVQGSNLTVNCWGNPADGNGGLWIFTPQTESTGTGNVMPDPTKWYNLITRAPGNRTGKCLELLYEGSDQLTANAGNGARANGLWSGTPANDNEILAPWQQWQFIKNPNGTDTYALVCKAKPNGSVNPECNSTGTDARWSYDDNTRNYNFVLGQHYGKDGDNYYYSIRSNLNAGYWLNMGNGAGLPVNCWYDPADGNGGIWTAVEISNAAPSVIYPEMTTPTTGSLLVISNATDLFPGQALADNLEKSEGLGYAPSGSYTTGWTVKSARKNSDNSVTVRLSNYATGRVIGAVGAETTPPGGGFASGGLGCPINMKEKTQPGIDVVIYRIDEKDPNLVAIKVGGRNIYPIDKNAQAMAGRITSGAMNNKIPGKIVGALWTIQNVNAWSIVMVDENNAYLGESGTYTDAKTSSAPNYAEICPQIPNYQLVKVENIDESSVKAIYRRVSNELTYKCEDTDGYPIRDIKAPIAIGQSVTLAAPELEFYTFERYADSSNANGKQISLNNNTDIRVVYRTEGRAGVSAATTEITNSTDLYPGKLLLIKNTHSSRGGFRYADASTDLVYGSGIDGGVSQYYIWKLEQGTGSSFKVLNIGNGKYVAPLVTSNQNPMVTDGENFLFSYIDRPSDQNWNGKKNWAIQGLSNNSYWNGVDANLMLVGWGEPHPHELYNFSTMPLFSLTIEEVDGDNGSTISTDTQWYRAGQSLIWLPRPIKGKVIESVTGNDGLNRISSHKTIKVTYKSEGAGVTEISTESPKIKGIYDLMGRKYEKLTLPGIYIINGKKVVVK